MTKPYRSKAICNINAAANHRAVRTTGNYASKGLSKTAKWLVTDHTNAAQRSNFMELQQKVNFIHADVNLMNRRTERVIESNRRYIATGIHDSSLDHTIGWWVDHSLYVFDLVWGFIWPIVSYLLMTILMIVLIIVFNVIFFYALYLLLTH
ncbi:MAG: hypothetical protein HOP25_09800 [Methylotenera sp.]|nr:hypothetical protein [Methylotenera sp.]